MKTALLTPTAIFWEQPPTYEELKEWHARSGLPLRRFFNTSGLKYKSLALKDKLPTMTEDAAAPACHRWHACQAAFGGRG